MATNTVRFLAEKTLTKPAIVKFKTKSGKTVSFKALNTFKKKKAVQFRARAKRGKST
jgi:HKD family nuclease